MQRDQAVQSLKFSERHENITALARLFIGTLIIISLLFIGNTICNIRDSASYSDAYTGGVLTPKQQEELVFRGIEELIVSTHGTWLDKAWYAVTRLGDSSLKHYESFLARNANNRAEQSKHIQRLQNSPPIPEISP
jgi:hypothetical protein